MVKLFIPDWVYIFCNIENGINILTLSKKSEVTYKTCLDYIYLFQEKKFIKLEKIRTANIIKLTDKGNKFQECLFIYISFINQ